MSMVDGPEVSKVQRAVRLAGLAEHCQRRRVVKGFGGGDWGKWARGPQRVSGEAGVVEKV